MSSDSTKPLVFIGSPHLDEPGNPAPGEVRWLTFVVDFLRPGENGRRYKVWIDRLMPGGARWNPEIEAKARAGDIFVLLVSGNSTGSDQQRRRLFPSLPMSEEEAARATRSYARSAIFGALFPSGGDLNTRKKIIGHHRWISAGTAIGVLSVGSV